MVAEDGAVVCGGAGIDLCGGDSAGGGGGAFHGRRERGLESKC